MYDWFIDTLNKVNFICISIFCVRGRVYRQSIDLNYFLLLYSALLFFFLFCLHKILSSFFFLFSGSNTHQVFCSSITFLFRILNTRLILFIHLQWTKHYERSIFVYQINSSSFCLSVSVFLFYGCTRYFLDDIWINTFFPTIKWMNWIEFVRNLNAKEDQYFAVYVPAEQ